MEELYIARLPKTLSGTIAAGLTDLAAIEADKRYKVYMGTWHKTADDVMEGEEEEIPWNEPEAGELAEQVTQPECFCCFAGAVMSQTFEVPIYETAEPADFEEWGKLTALDYVRTGSLDLAIIEFYSVTGSHKYTQQEMRAKRNILPSLIKVTRYEDDKIKWRKDMEAIVKQLAEKGL